MSAPFEGATPSPWPEDLLGIFWTDSRGGGYIDTADAALIVFPANNLDRLLRIEEATREFMGARDAWLATEFTTYEAEKAHEEARDSTEAALRVVLAEKATE